MKIYKALSRSSLDVWNEIGQDFDPQGALNLVASFCYKRKLPFDSELTLKSLDETMWIVQGTKARGLLFFIAEEEVDYDESEIEED